MVGLSTVPTAGCLSDDGNPTAEPEAEFEIEREDDYELPVNPDRSDFVDRTGQSVVEIVTVWRENKTPEFVFDPPFVRVDQGTTIRWINGNGVFHSVTATESLADRSQSGAFNAQIAADGATFEWEADTPGRQHYYCTPHARFMFGTISVL